VTDIQKLNHVHASIEAYAERYQRATGEVKLIAVSKTRSAEAVLSLHQAGQQCFGENYLQEALAKIVTLAEYPIEWHFIGAIQSKKAVQIAQNFSWVHSLDRLKVANKLDQHADSAQPLNVLIQVNLEGEASKGGVSPVDLKDLALAVDALQNLNLRGLMFMPKVHPDFEAQRAIFRQAKQVFAELRQVLPAIDQLSMGMSADMQAAIAEGATMVRIGTALFGTREVKK